MKTARKSVAALMRSGYAMLDADDSLRAAACFLEAVNRGSAEGAYMLGLMYSDGYYMDFVLDDRLSFHFFLRAADNGHVMSQMRVADMYAEGCGVEKSRKEADRYWKAAAKTGDSDAQSFYASFLFFHADEAERQKNAAAAKRLFKAAAAKGDAAASIALREIKHWEKYGVLKNTKEDLEAWLNSDIENDPDGEEDSSDQEGC